jgi:hypothetical protein
MWDIIGEVLNDGADQQQQHAFEDNIIIRL